MLNRCSAVRFVLLFVQYYICSFFNVKSFVMLYNRMDKVFLAAFTFFLFLNNPMHAGFGAGVEVEIFKEIIPIEQIKKDDHVVSWDLQEDYTLAPVIAVTSKKVSTAIRLEIEEDTLICDSEQLFYLPEEHRWCKARDLELEKKLLRHNGTYASILYKEIIPETTCIYDISVQDYHNFLVTKQGIVVHNFAMAIPLLAYGCGSVTLFEGFSLAALETAFLYAAFEHVTGIPTTVNIGTSRTTSRGGPCSCGHLCLSGCNCGCSCGCGINQTSHAILKNGYYEVNGFRFSEYYYNRLWNTGRKAPSLIVQSILENATSITADAHAGCFMYKTAEWEMIYNPSTHTIHHLKPL